MSMAGMTEVSVIKTFLIALLGIIKVVRVRLLTHKDKCRHNELVIVHCVDDTNHCSMRFLLTFLLDARCGYIHKRLATLMYFNLVQLCYVVVYCLHGYIGMAIYKTAKAQL